jgi:proteasome lid subunit RPN8/RPN11
MSKGNDNENRLKAELRTAGSVSVRESRTNEKMVSRQFPGPQGAAALLRVAIEPAAFAELIAHAKELLNVEVCGVLVGELCQNDDGPFVHVENVIRGTAASQASTHVTFTQATWNAIYQTLERDYPKKRIVGWYHTHPGFGVEFSDMDLFIQKNFFSGTAQIALVTDPLSGAVAICANTPKGLEYLPRFWVGGREHAAGIPAGKSSPHKTSSVASPTELDKTSVDKVEARLAQLMQAIDDQRASFHRFLLLMGVVFCLGIVVAVGYSIYSQMVNRNKPPELNQVVPIPIQVGDKAVLLGVGITTWDVPPELNAVMVQLEKARREAEEKAAREASNSSKTNQPKASK